MERPEIIGYKVEKYAADGHGGPNDEYLIGTARTLKAARAIVRRALGLKRLSSARRWTGGEDDMIEAYHDYLASEPKGVGCGGVSIAPSYAGDDQGARE